MAPPDHKMQHNYSSVTTVVSRAGGLSPRCQTLPTRPDGAGSYSLAVPRRNRVPTVTSRWATPRAMKNAVGAVSPENPNT